MFPIKNDTNNKKNRSLHHNWYDMNDFSMKLTTNNKYMERFTSPFFYR